MKSKSFNRRLYQKRSYQDPHPMDSRDNLKKWIIKLQRKEYNQEQDKFDKAYPQSKTMNNIINESFLNIFIKEWNLILKFEAYSLYFP